MKVKIKFEQEVDIKFLKVSAGVRGWEDAVVNGEDDEDGDLIPCRNGDRWEPLIDIDKGQIVNWNQGTTAEIHYKVCDDGVYTLMDANQKSIAERNDYVPEIMCPDDEGYGDYIIMTVDAHGFIANWNPDLDDMIGEEG